jgi:hypothetical protein
MVAAFFRAVAAVAVCFVLLAVSGCNGVGSREAIGQRIDLKDKEAQASKDFEALTTHVWVQGKEGEKKVAYEFKAESGGQGAVMVRAMGDKEKEMTFMGFVRVWEDRLILNIGWVDQERQKPMLLCFMVKVNRGADGRLTGQYYGVRKEAIKAERTTAQGKKVKLEFYASENPSDVIIRSDEGVIAEYLSTCKPGDLFEADQGEVWRGVTAEEWKKMAATQPSGE